MKILLSFLATILIINTCYSQSELVDYKIDNKVSVKLSMQPSKNDENSVYVKNKDSSVFIVAKFDLYKMAGIDSAQIAAQAPTKEFADSFKNGMLGKMPGTTMGEVAIGKWKGYISYNMDGGNISKKLKVYAFVFFVGANMYSLLAILPADRSTAGKDNFFGSLVLSQ